MATNNFTLKGRPVDLPGELDENDAFVFREILAIAEGREDGDTISVSEDEILERLHEKGWRLDGEGQLIPLNKPRTNS